MSYSSRTIRRCLPALALVVAALTAAAPAQAAPAPEGSFSYSGDTYDGVAPGASGSFASPTGSFTLTGTTSAIRFTATAEGENWEVWLEPDDGTQMEVGQSYYDTLDSDSALVHVAGNGRECYDDYAAVGKFTVMALRTDRDTGAITEFAATYEQSCTDGPATLRGSLSYRAE